MDHMSIRTSRSPAGVPCWIDLTVPDVAAAKEFTTFALPGEQAPLGGMGAMMGGPGMPAHWVVYFGVPNAAAAVAAAERKGGSVLMREIETPYGQMAGLADPAGGPDRSG